MKQAEIAWPEYEYQSTIGLKTTAANHGYAANLNPALIPTGYDNTVIAIRVGE